MPVDYAKNLRKRPTIADNVAAEIKRRIDEGEYARGAALPARRKLAEEYSVAVETLQQAIVKLMAAGVVWTENGRGTFVCPDTLRGGTRIASDPEAALKIGVFLRDPRAMFDSDSYIAHIWGGIRSALGPYGLKHAVSFVEDVDLNRFLEKPTFEISGLLMVSPDIDKRSVIDPIYRKGLPVVVVGSSWLGLEAPAIDCDNESGMHAAIDILVEAGHTQIGCGVINANACQHFDRGQAFRTGLARHGLPLPEGYLIERWRPTYEEGTAELKRLLGMANRPTALVAADPNSAMNALNVATDLGLRVPKDLSVITFDDTVRARRSKPPLTTIEAPFEEMGEAAMSLLIDICLGKEGVAKPTLRPMNVTHRESVARRER